MIARVRLSTAGYPRQYWVLFWGLLINSIGGGLWWPFLTIYMRERLAVPLTTITLLFTLNAVAGLAAMSVAGPAVDRFGRRFAMIIGLVANGSILLAMSAAQALPVWALLMLVQGFFNPFYRVGSDAMVADLIPPARRAGAYALLRMINNLGIAIGPAIGGFVIGVSYGLAFYIAAVANLLFVILIVLFVRETLPSRTAFPVHGSGADDGVQVDAPKREGGYGPVLRDRPFVALCGVFVLATMPAAIMMMLLAVYAKENFGVPERQYGFIMATNAAMVVLLQYAVTRRARRLSSAASAGVGRVLLRNRHGQRRVGRRLLGVLAQHGDPDDRRAADRADGDRRGRQPGAAGHARPVHGALRYHVGCRLRHWPGDRGLPQRQCGAEGDLDLRPDRGADGSSRVPTVAQKADRASGIHLHRLPNQLPDSEVRGISSGQADVTAYHPETSDCSSGHLFLHVRSGNVCPLKDGRVPFHPRYWWRRESCKGCG